MQTFLPSSSFLKSAKILDNKRLGKQRVEAYQILLCLLVKETRWKNHPAVKMWKGYESALFDYMCSMCATWEERGFNNKGMSKNIKKLLKQFVFVKTIYNKPPWLGNRSFHASHRSNLLRKDKAYYSKFGWKEPDNLPYVWPESKFSTVSAKAV